MIALARKELRQFALVLVLPVLWIVLRVQDDDLGERFLAPSETWQTLGVLLPAAFLAACFGLVQFVREEQTRTLSYLVHRELGAARLLAGKASAGILLVAVLAFAPPLGSYGAALALSPLADVLQPLRLVAELAVACAALPAYAAGVFAAGLRGSPSTRGLVALGGAACVLALGVGAMTLDLPPGTELAGFPLACAAACVALLAAARYTPLFLAERERMSRAPSPSAALPSALVALLFVVVPGWGFAAAVGAVSAGAATGGIRHIVGDVSPEWRPGHPLSEPVRYREHEGGTEEGRAGAIAGIVRERRREDPAASLLEAAQRSGGGLGARWSELPGLMDLDVLFGRRKDPRSLPPGASIDLDTLPVGPGWLDRDRGVVLVVRRVGWPHLEQSAPLELEVVAPAGGRLARETLVLGDAEAGFFAYGSPLLLDPGTRRPYALRLEGDRLRLAEVELPGGDSLRSWRAGRFALHLDPDAPARVSAELLTIALEGESGRYVWHRGELRRTGEELPLGPAPHEPITDPIAATAPHLVTLRSDRDPLRPVREVVAADGRVLLRDAHAITGARRVAEVLALGLFLAQGPVNTTRPHARAEVLPLAAVTTYPQGLVRGGRRPWLVGAHVAVSLGLAVLAWRRLGGRGASRRRALAWSVAIALLGPLAFAVHVLLEPRAERRAEPARAPRMLVASVGGGSG